MHSVRVSSQLLVSVFFLLQFLLILEITNFIILICVLFLVSTPSYTVAMHTIENMIFYLHRLDNTMAMICSRDYELLIWWLDYIKCNI